MFREKIPTEIKKVSRREFVAGALALALMPGVLSACKRKFVRPGGDLRLGTVRSLLYPYQHISEKAIMLYRDQGGWSAMSTRCTYDGCDLTFQERNFLCSCCESEFTHDGGVIEGPAEDSLPWYEVYYKDTFLFVNTAKPVSKKARFSDPKIEAALAELARKVRVGEIAPRSEIPNLLLGKAGEDIPDNMEKFERRLEYLDEKEVAKDTRNIVRGVTK